MNDPNDTVQAVSDCLAKALATDKFPGLTYEMEALNSKEDDAIGFVVFGGAKDHYHGGVDWATARGVNADLDGVIDAHLRAARDGTE